MPVIFSVPEVFELLKYGTFLAVSLKRDLDPNTPNDAPVVIKLPVEENYSIITERFCFDGSEFGAARYEMWYSSNVLGAPYQKYCSDPILRSNADNRSTHIRAADFVELKLWNETPYQVHIEFAVWFYKYFTARHKDVMAILEREPDLLDRIANQIEEVIKIQQSMLARV